MLGWGHPEALPGLASPSLPPLRLVMVHSEAGLDVARRQGEGQTGASHPRYPPWA